jgi:hypothetical protein
VIARGADQRNALRREKTVQRMRHFRFSQLRVKARCSPSF